LGRKLKTLNNAQTCPVYHERFVAREPEVVVASYYASDKLSNCVVITNLPPPPPPGKNKIWPTYIGAKGKKKKKEPSG
jgi:hypothetical protein